MRPSTFEAQISAMRSPEAASAGKQDGRADGDPYSHTGRKVCCAASCTLYARGMHLIVVGGGEIGDQGALAAEHAHAAGASGGLSVHLVSRLLSHLLQISIMTYFQKNKLIRSLRCTLHVIAMEIQATRRKYTEIHSYIE